MKSPAEIYFSVTRPSDAFLLSALIRPNIVIPNSTLPIYVTWGTSTSGWSGQSGTRQQWVVASWVWDQDICPGRVSEPIKPA